VTAALYSSWCAIAAGREMVVIVVVDERMSVEWGEEVGVKVGRRVGRRKPNLARHTLTCELV
jgi:hypothetical protein